MLAPTFMFLLAQLPAEVVSVAGDMAQRDFKWWFGIVFGIMVSSGTYVFKLQIAQLAEQRKANMDTTTQLISYLKEDHTRATATLKKVGLTLEKITSVLQRYEASNTLPPHP